MFLLIILGQWQIPLELGILARKRLKLRIVSVVSYIVKS